MLDSDRLNRTLGSPHLAWIVKRYRQRLEQGKPLQRTLRLPRPTPDERTALARLFGGRVPLHGALTVRTDKLAALLLETQICDDLPAAIAALTGPIADRAAERRRRIAEWSAVFATVGEQAAGRPQIANWLGTAETQHWVRRLCKQDPSPARTLLEQTLRVTALLPATGIPLAELAATAAGDSHALDAGQPLATLVLRAASQLAEVDSRDSAALRRSAWDRLGVLVDELSAPVLVLNLKGDSGTVAGRALLLHADAGEPYRLSVRQLLREAPEFTLACVGPTVFVCENPTVVAAAADRLGHRSAPLICLEGQPKSAGTLLLRQLAAAGVQIVYHGDFDWAGIRIANLVLERHSARPWRFDVATYEGTSGGTSLRGDPVAATWDPHLEPAMRAAGRAVHEEQLLDVLLGDLYPQSEKWFQPDR